MSTATMTKDVSRAGGHFSTLLTGYVGDVQITAVRVRGMGDDYLVGAKVRATANPRTAFCGASLIDLGHVRGGRGVAGRAMALAQTAVAAGAHVNERHDAATCVVCTFTG